MRPQRQPRYDAETAATSPLEGPEQIGMHAGIGDTHHPIGGHNLGFQ
jgi:hypothetical protein